MNDLNDEPPLEIKSPFDSSVHQSTHVTGGTIMGSDAHNLLIVGGSVFAHNAGYNPPWPLAALTLRVGDDMASQVARPRMP